MEEQVPANLKNAAILQLVSGLLNFTIMPVIVYFTLALCCGLATFWAFGIGAVCGFVGFVLWPIGIFEIVSGGMTLANPKSGGKIMKICSYVELGSILCGGLVSCVAGGVVMSMLKDEEVTAYLEG
ncbi:MAG: hypothetical protein HN348_19455 [Proteobacteria bacterium]|jgi:hypothetical protein|nr:hypothetical protein [Pseudomonadota bacterium]